MIKALYVEDNDDNIYMLSQRLKRKHFEVHIAQDGQEGIEKALTLQPDIILMDLNLPIKDGWQAITELKHNRLTKHIPIIALSAHAMPQHIENAVTAGANDFDTKPIDFKRLLSKIETAMNKRQ